MKYALPFLLLLGACVEEPTPKEAEKAADALSQDEVKARKKTIEEAAEEAAKLVEADAKAEIDTLQPAEQKSE